MTITGSIIGKRIKNEFVYSDLNGITAYQSTDIEDTCSGIAVDHYAEIDTKIDTKIAQKYQHSTYTHAIDV